MIGMFDGQYYRHFRSVEDFLNHVLTKRYRGWRFFAHFGGRYDVNFIFDYLLKSGHTDFNFICVGSNVIGMTIRKGKNWIKLTDSMHLMPAGQDSLCQAFGTKHQKVEVKDFDNASLSVLIERNYNDCLGLYEVLTMFFEESGITSETFATHALRIFRRDFLRKKLWIPPPFVEEFVHQSYYGGRVEVYRRGAPDLNCYDFNSMYPYCMTLPVPVYYLGRTREIDQPDDRFAFLHAIVDMPEVLIPPLPVEWGKLIFPTGRIEGVFAHVELERAIEAGARVDVRDGVVFRSEPIFKDYARTLYEQKKTAGEPKRTIAKFLLNSLYGKFGQHREKSRFKITRDDEGEGWIPIVNESTGELTGISEQKTFSRAAHILPHIAAAVTARARNMLYDLLLKHDPYYADTDSIFTRETLGTSDDLGGLELIGQGEAEFYQPKLYRFNGEWKAKGLPTSDDKLRNAFVNGKACRSAQDLLVAFTAGEQITFDRGKSVLESTRFGGPSCQNVQVKRSLKDQFPKRAWIGRETRPWKIGTDMYNLPRLY